MPDRIGTQGNGSDMASAAERLEIAVAERARADINRIADEVFATHALLPVADVLAELIERSETLALMPGVETLRAAAYAISSGRRYVSV